MFNTILTSIKTNGETVQRVYQGETERLSVHFATNLWRYDKEVGEDLISLETTDRDINNRSLYMIDMRNPGQLNA